MASNLYAVGTGKWVEIRRASSPPKLVSATVKREIQTVRYIPTQGCFRPVTRIYNMKQSIREGGKVVKVVSKNAFAKLTLVGLRQGGVVRVTKKIVDQLEER